MASISSEDWKNITKKIDAAIKQAIKDMSPTGWAHAVSWLRQIGTLANIAAILLALIAITVGALYQAFAHVKEETQFRTHTEDRLTAIEGALLALRTTQAAASPLNPGNQAEAKALIAMARKERIQIPATVVQHAGEQFVDVARENLKAWGV